MGREAVTIARFAGQEGQAKALLETHELILRGERKAKWPLASLSGVAVDGEWLTFVTTDGPAALRLGAKDAASWARKIATPPPSLADKLGVAAGVQVVGEIDDPALAGALAPSTDPKLTLAIVRGLADLDAALAAHASLPADAHIWLVNVKGSKSPFGENAIRTAMRAAGFMDNKTAQVSDRYAATRYQRRKA